MLLFNIKVPVYNWSSYYALAVIKLGEAVQRKMPKTP